MKEKVFDVLMYLFENYMDDGQEFNPDQESITVELTEAGFPRGEIHKAFTWLEELSALRDQKPEGMHAASSQGAIRCYSAEEKAQMNRDCRGLLLRLEQRGVLDSYTRELVVDRVMALEAGEVDMEQLKWIALMVLFNQPEQDHNYAVLEDHVFGERHEHLQ